MKSKKINTAALKMVIRFLLTFVATMFLLTMAWSGAECIFEGQMHTSVVDFVICIVLSYFLSWEAVKIQCKLIRLKKIDEAKLKDNE